MKIVVHADGPTIRGNERQTVQIAEGLAKRGHRIVASCRAGGVMQTAFERAGIPATGVRPRGDLDFWHAGRFSAWLHREQPDAVLFTSWTRAWIAGWAARRAGVPRVVLRVGDVHGFESRREAWKYRRALTKHYDAIIVNSRTILEYLLEAVPGLEPERVHVVPNGLQLQQALPLPLRAELGIPPDALLLLAVGGLERKKGHDLLISALARMDGRVHLVIAGDGREREALRGQAESLGLGERVHLLGHRSDVPAVLAACDVFVMSSRREGMPVAMLEAIAARRPVVATEVGGVWEALAPREGRPPGGWIVPPRDEAAVAAALVEVVALLRTRPGAVRRRVEEAAWRLENWFTVERMVDGYEAVLRGG